ncbi:MAG: hypothetical protein RSE13_01440 [Planktothrix sp. GU0601_MAG3]|nr:MAG: hypothetical protein RSE13_01440 [Planktothrix sp. GU0601_MAG3]
MSYNGVLFAGILIMIVNPSDYKISHQDYLEGEKISPIRHEYIRGEVYAMVGGSDAHETIAGNLFALIKNKVRGNRMSSLYR